MNKTVIGSIAAMLVLGVGVVFAARGALSAGPADRAAGQLTVSTAAPEDEGASASVTGRPDCLSGTVAGVDLPCLGGEATGPAADEGITIVNVWAWWCEPCRTEMPHLMEVAAAHPEWKVVGVHADTNAGNGAAFLEDTGVEMSSFQDSDNKFAGTLGLPGVIPITVVLKDGEVQGRIIKAMTSAEDIETSIEEYL